jgi:hypothetical protein
MDGRNQGDSSFPFHLIIIQGAIAATLEHFFETNQVKSKKKASVNPSATGNPLIRNNSKEDASLHTSSLPKETIPPKAPQPQTPPEKPDTTGITPIHNYVGLSTRKATLTDLKRVIPKPQPTTPTKSEDDSFIKEKSQLSQLYRESKTMKELWGQILKMPENTMCCECSSPGMKLIICKNQLFIEKQTQNGHLLIWEFLFVLNVLEFIEVLVFISQKYEV